jgi:hypothetical protein
MLVCDVLLRPGPTLAEPVPVKFAEGLVHGFLVLRTADGTAVADGDLIQSARGDEVTSRLVFRFKDGSLRDETAVFSQRQNFRLLRDHLVQKGPTFPQPLDMSIECSSGQVTVRYTDEHGQQRVETERMELPPDLANGIILTLLKNVRPDAVPPTLSMVATAPTKPRLVKLNVTNAGEESFSTGGMSRKATHYIVKIEIGGLSASSPRRQTAARYARLGSRRRRSRVCKVGRTAVSRRTDLADRAHEPRLAKSAQTKQTK